MGGTEEILSFVRSNAIRLALLGVALLLAIIGAALVNTNGYDEAWSVLSILILVAALYLDGRIVLFYIVLGFIYAVLPTWIVLSSPNVNSGDSQHGAALLSAALFLALFSLTPSDGWSQFRSHFLGSPVGWFALVVFVCNFFGCILVWIAVGKNTSLIDTSSFSPDSALAISILAFLNGLLFLISYAYQYPHSSVLGFLVFTFTAIQALAVMVDTAFSDTARAGAAFIAFPNFVFIFIIWRVCMAPLAAAQQANAAGASAPANVSGTSVDTTQGAAPQVEQQGWRATIVSSLVRFVGLAGCLAVCIIGLLIIRDTQSQAVFEIAAAASVGLLLTTLFFPTWDYSFIFIYLGVFFTTIPLFVLQRSDHQFIIDGRSSSEIDSGLVFIIIGTVSAYFIREFSLARVQRFTIGRDMMWLYVVGMVGELLLIIGLIVLFAVAGKETADVTLKNVTIPLVLLLIYFFIQLHLDADLNHRFVLLFLLAFFLEADIVAATSQDDTNNTKAERRAGCGLCAIALYLFQFALSYMHWNETHKRVGTVSGPSGGEQSAQQVDGRDETSGAATATTGGGGVAPNPYQQQVDDPHMQSDDQQAQSEAPVQTV